MSTSCINVKDLEQVNAPLADFYRQMVAKEAKRSAAAAEEERKVAAAAARKPVDVSVRVGNTCRRLENADGSAVFEWVAHVTPVDVAQVSKIAHVTFHLHPTFHVNVIRVDKAPFAIRRRGWGTFPVRMVVEDVYGGVHELSHDLRFDVAQCASTHCFRVTPPAPPASTAVPVAGPGAGSGAGAGAGAGAGRATTTPGGGTDVSEDTPRMEGVAAKEMHGRLAKSEWRAPLLVTYCDRAARPGYETMQAHEYNDDEATLRGKIKVLASLIRKAKHCIAYTGAGISTASGINDYASKAKNSVATGSRAQRKKKSGLDAEPTFAHYALTALHDAHLLKHWLQQNHDGLPQKAGFAQQHLNEIHGAWFDPSNPVVPMDGSLRSDLYAWLEAEEERADLVLAMGTSLCGMNADRVVTTPSRKAARGKALGSVIIGLQRTRLDSVCSLRLYAKIDEVMLLLAMEMGLPVPLKRYKMTIPNDARVGEATAHTFMVPYDSRGRPTTRGGRRMKWTLKKGSRIRITAGPGKGFEGTVYRVSPDGVASYTVMLPCQREGSRDHGKGMVLYAMGPWMVEAACKGHLTMLPFVNC